MIDDFVSGKSYGREELSHFSNVMNEKYHVDMNPEFLERIDTDIIALCINEPTNKGIYSSKSIARKFCIVISRFFKYCFHKKWLENAKLLSELTADRRLSKITYFSHIENIIKANRALKNVSSKEMLSESDTQMMLDYADDEFKSLGALRSEKEYNRAGALLAVQLMILIGVKYEIIRELRVYDFMLGDGTIRLNGYNIILPSKICDDILNYINARNKKSDDYMFTDSSKRQWAEKTTSSGIPDCLKFVSTTSVSCATKNAINTLALSGVSIIALCDITGYSYGYIRKCIEEENADYKFEFSKKINLELVNTPAFSALSK